ncbi:hypothetical protein A2631_01655 [Candidatus Daviesbacteria bacterium RIFCSPHIGHO2_01_FULL_44_29]|uniref:NodB homology domain-containing protein n=1 Tax=Candidatus Daviesbacteria bacterium RIFCSPHIGHO2_02_FULL_43_12 TaxID=1797776 RepID=A0A1F5KJU5_9BACT|nr:MAG: hypothetical protein A2631_01655 [Candidatus Daviesbacteria bacterium RIFCSPHIGHO2_01_FULL_44_29]OGE39047.1 MAG: hypothetical protein A3E86_00425 [Candidatus Daviesbacteria bacterium RIFCSPHIGHO2_12_FULL_47_45]OGE41109.1 MAG: hypothetical protein A3D25_01050 [Candidatus Daviesbacteria bacterium RIFCSPHIGHO2_02_FULL_43_12]OGE69308.1 MAG: hypothetical protein A3B55_02790 [Candidatus Daviesbacteria bacterium RIFCSPLOWO2_01_FULL_43_15]
MFGVKKISLALCLILSLLIFAFIFLPKTPNQIKVSGTPLSSIRQSILTAVQATAAASTPKPKTATSSAYFIPKNYGRQINVPILMYHYIGANPNPGKDLARDNLSVTPELFEEQLNYLVSNGYHTISLDTLHAILMGTVPAPQKPIVLTFDDGYIDFYINAYPIIRRLDIHVTSFLPTGLIGTSYYMNWDQVKEIHSSGLVSFQAHTIHHANLPTLSLDQAKEEISQSKQTLEAILGVPINFFSYPYGTSNPALWKLVRESGFVGAVGTWTGRIESEGNLFNMPRIKIPGGLPLADFIRRI